MECVCEGRSYSSAEMQLAHSTTSAEFINLNRNGFMCKYSWVVYF